jgi:hypothetical protein
MVVPYKNHTLEPFKDLGFDSQMNSKHASQIHMKFVDYAATHFHTRCALSSTITNS